MSDRELVTIDNNGEYDSYTIQVYKRKARTLVWPLFVIGALTLLYGLIHCFVFLSVPDVRRTGGSTVTYVAFCFETGIFLLCVGTILIFHLIFHPFTFGRPEHIVVVWLASIFAIATGGFTYSVGTQYRNSPNGTLYKINDGVNGTDLNATVIQCIGFMSTNVTNYTVTDPSGVCATIYNVSVSGLAMPIIIITLYMAAWMLLVRKPLADVAASYESLIESYKRHARN